LVIDCTRTGASPPTVMMLVFQATVAWRVALLGDGPKGSGGSELLERIVIY